MKHDLSHAPENYICPFCLLVRGIENEHVYSVQSDILYQDEIVTAFVSSHQPPNSAGNVLVIPNEHFENVYSFPPHFGNDVQRVVRAVALAQKAAFACEGISTRQHNEPAGYQDVWHYHVHVTPRYSGDGLYGSKSRLMPAEERAYLARTIKAHLRTNW
jgi:histidine triad (HIT) family protein